MSIQRVQFVQLLFAQITAQVDAIHHDDVVDRIQHEQGRDEVNQVVEEQYRDIVIAKNLEAIVFEVEKLRLIGSQVN